VGAVLDEVVGPGFSVAYQHARLARRASEQHRARVHDFLSESFLSLCLNRISLTSVFLQELD
jgi:hypothetical protein